MQEIISGIHLIFMKDNQIYLHKRLGKFRTDHYSVPGGHIEGNETPTQCAIRESAEELNYILEEKDIKMVHVIYRNQKETGQIRIDFCFLIENFDSNKFQNLEPTKHTNLESFKIINLPTPIVPYVEDAINYIRKGIPYSESEF